MKIRRIIDEPENEKETALDVVLEYPWHRWFAWHPVQVENFIVWLETIERRRVTKRCKITPLYASWHEYRYAA